jgi:hypothetical protein
LLDDASWDTAASLPAFDAFILFLVTLALDEEPSETLAEVGRSFATEAGGCGGGAGAVIGAGSSSVISSSSLNSKYQGHVFRRSSAKSVTVQGLAMISLTPYTFGKMVKGFPLFLDVESLLGSFVAFLETVDQQATPSPSSTMIGLTREIS